MTKRRWPILMLLLSAGTFLVIEACSLTGPDASPRQSGCIGGGCFEGGTPEDGGPAPVPDATTPDAPVGFGDPLLGTSKTGTLVKGGGINFAEGPIWVGNRLLFSDVGNSNILQLLSDGGVTTFRPNSGGANGNAVDTQGRLVTCEGNRGRITRTDAQLANPTTVTDSYMAKPFNAPNDVIVRADGTIYFTDPFYGTPPDGGIPQDKKAVYRVPAAGGAALRVAFDFIQPNGIALSPDGNTLYVVENSDGRVLFADLNTDGSVKGAFAKVADADGGDGMTVDQAGNLYVAAKAGVLVFDKTGKDLGTITFAQGTPSNVAFGGADMKTLYITSNNGGGNPATGLYSIKLNVPGLR
jgi:gluconolactonase